MLHLLVTLGLVAVVATSDYACTRRGGTCQDWRLHTCPAGYETGKCSGGVNRKCCKRCISWTCLRDRVPSFRDRACTSLGGRCIHNTNYCQGSFSSGKCGGSSARQCCRRNPFVGNAFRNSFTSRSRTSGAYGNINRVQTTGASQTTARQDRLTFHGVRASQTMAKTDSGRMLGYKSLIRQAGQAYNVDPAVIAGIISRETRAGNILDRRGYGDHGNGFGLMQVDKRYHRLQGGPYSLEHLKQGTGILVDMIKGVSRKFPSWTAEKKLKGGISAYNAGVNNVRSYDRMDVGTTGGDYANDVVARAQYYKANGY